RRSCCASRKASHRPPASSELHGRALQSHDPSDARRCTPPSQSRHLAAQPPKLFQLLTPHNNMAHLINPVNLEHVLRQIQTNHANLRHGRSPLPERINTTSLALMMPSGAVHTIIPGSPPSVAPRNDEPPRMTAK